MIKLDKINKKQIVLVGLVLLFVLTNPTKNNMSESGIDSNYCNRKYYCFLFSIYEYKAEERIDYASCYVVNHYNRTYLGILNNFFTLKNNDYQKKNE